MALSRLWPFVRRDPGDAPLSSEDGSPGDHPGAIQVVLHRGASAPRRSRPGTITKPSRSGSSAWGSTPTDNACLTQAVMHRKGRRLARVEVRATIGPPAALPYAVFLERLNGKVGNRLGCLTRKTHAFAKQAALWDAPFGLTLYDHNWLRPHIALRVRLAEWAAGRRYDQRTPAMAIGITDRVCTWTEFLTMRGKAH